MSNETQNPYQPNQWQDAVPQQPAGIKQYAVPPMPPQAPKKATKLKRFGLPVGLLLLGLVIGGASGASAVPDPVEVVKEVPGPERVVEKKVTVNVPTTPASCLEALDINEQAFSYVSESMGHILDGNYSAASTSTERMKALVPKANAAKAECRASR